MVHLCSQPFREELVGLPLGRDHPLQLSQISVLAKGLAPHPGRGWGSPPGPMWFRGVLTAPRWVGTPTHTTAAHMGHPLWTPTFLEPPLSGLAPLHWLSLVVSEGMDGETQGPPDPHPPVGQDVRFRMLMVFLDSFLHLTCVCVFKVLLINSF